jgi:putative FmdB family regulatory protein
MDCSTEFERFQSMTEEPVRLCPTCGGKVNRLIGGGSGLIFKGSGFYLTDYKNKKPDYKRADSTIKSDKQSKSTTKKPEKLEK